MTPEDAAHTPAPADIVIRGGRVVDPRSAQDGIADVAVRDGRIIAVGQVSATARSTIDARGLVVAPGFIDLHSHAQTPIGLGFQALDGVTTALDLESGTLPVQAQYAAAVTEGRPINFGFAASWAVARMHVMAGIPLPTPAEDGTLTTAMEVFQRNQRLPAWHRIATRAEVDSIIGVLADAVSQGAIGIGVLLGYAPASGREEYFRVAELAESAGVAVFTHSRQMSNQEPGSSVDGALEVIAAAAGSGARMHMCHINSTSLRRIDDVARAVTKAQSRGNQITTEAYPYTMSSTGIGAAFLAPDRLDRLGIEASAITYLPTGTRVRDVDELAHLRATDPGGLCLIDYLDGDDPVDVRTLLRSFDVPGTVVASDAMPIVGPDGRYLSGRSPLPEGSRVHPRSVGTFARTFGWLVRDLGALSLPDAVLRTSTIPAEILAPFVPRMRTKGRVAPGFDADITVFDPHRINDRASAIRIEASVGVRHVIVGGEPVVIEGALRTGTAGRPLKSR
ncbi:amidohydrolase family protein [Microbacterium sp. 5K110]|jgi:N-acyl-D-aspartate/D-glutamate deacylase|uniref:amidohydrolase family protein n=1 Tax=unclassified Microbacterium TaxID=2609290 RepID=UPI0010FD8D32|nr:amidohydrolase family protein [Microbacterium sp. 5K110]TLF33621.1 D-glutamate deacylase [Microbacterium sp. 5K110]